MSTHEISNNLPRVRHSNIRFIGITQKRPVLVAPDSHSHFIQIKKPVSTGSSDQLEMGLEPTTYALRMRRSTD